MARDMKDNKRVFTSVSVAKTKTREDVDTLLNHKIIWVGRDL